VPATSHTGPGRTLAEPDGKTTAYEAVLRELELKAARAEAEAERARRECLQARLGALGELEVIRPSTDESPP